MTAADIVRCPICNGLGKNLSIHIPININKPTKKYFRCISCKNDWKWEGEELWVICTIMNPWDEPSEAWVPYGYLFVIWEEVDIK